MVRVQNSSSQRATTITRIIPTTWEGAAARHRSRHRRSSSLQGCQRLTECVHHLSESSSIGVGVGVGVEVGAQWWRDETTVIKIQSPVTSRCTTIQGAMTEGLGLLMREITSQRKSQHPHHPVQT